MACLPASHIFEAKEGRAKRRIQVTSRYIVHIEKAKTLVVGVIANDAQTKMRREFESAIPAMDEFLQVLVSGALDGGTDEQLAALARTLQLMNEKMSTVIDGATRIGLEAIDPFPQLLAQFRAQQYRVQSQLEGILLSLDDSFQDVLANTANEIRALG